MAKFDIPESFLDFYDKQGMGNVDEQETAYDPYAYSDIGSRALGGEKIYNRNFYWFDPVTQKSGMTTEGYSRVLIGPDLILTLILVQETLLKLNFINQVGLE